MPSSTHHRRAMQNEIDLGMIAGLAALEAAGAEVTSARWNLCFDGSRPSAPPQYGLRSSSTLPEAADA